MKNKYLVLFPLLGLLYITAISFVQKQKPTLYLIGDSTVEGGWGKFIAPYFDTTRLQVRNWAIAGTSSRTFYTKGVHDPSKLKYGLWEGVVTNLKSGDVVIMQFGHNDASPLVDTSRSRGSLKGIGNDTQTVFNRFLKRKEVVHTYGWYLNAMIAEAKSKGVLIVVCSPIPKNRWQNGKVLRATADYGKWSWQMAEKNRTPFLDLNNKIADRYDAEGEAKTSTYFNTDGTHTNADGSALNAFVVMQFIKNNHQLMLRQYLIN